MRDRGEELVLDAAGLLGAPIEERIVDGNRHSLGHFGSQREVLLAVVPARIGVEEVCDDAQRATARDQGYGKAGQGTHRLDGGKMFGVESRRPPHHLEGEVGEEDRRAAPERARNGVGCVHAPPIGV